MARRVKQTLTKADKNPSFSLPSRLGSPMDKARFNLVFLASMSEKIAVIGLGYVGLPLLLGLARHFENVIGFDIDERRIKALRSGEDWTEETASADLKATCAKFTSDTEQLKHCTFFIATVPTPIDQAKRPDLRLVLGACKTIGDALKGHSGKKPVPLVVFESTVYPGLTEDICGAKIAEYSGLKQHKDFKLGYSPERINPGDKKNRLETITKIISAEDAESLARMETVYGKVVEAPLHHATSIRVAEAAKVLENTQRDLNVALMNELAIICDRMNIRTHDVLEAAGTKWNFLKFTPGLVGGHCIGVDPYYLTFRAEELGYHPQVILAGRRINDNMPVFLAQKIVKLLGQWRLVTPAAHAWAYSALPLRKMCATCAIAAYRKLSASWRALASTWSSTIRSPNPRTPSTNTGSTCKAARRLKTSMPSFWRYHIRF